MVTIGTIGTVQEHEYWRHAKRRLVDRLHGLNLGVLVSPLLARYVSLS